MNRHQNDNFWIGFLVGAVVPVLGYLMISELFSFLSTSGIMDDVSLSTFGKRERTTLLLSIACNIIAVQYFNKTRKGPRTLQGVVLATFIYAGFWLYRYYDMLMYNF